MFFSHQVADLQEDERRFTLTVEDLALLNPNTRTCPIFRSKRDAELTKSIYRRVPVLIKEGPPQENPWGMRFLRMFDMSNDSHLFMTRNHLENVGFTLKGNVFQLEDDVYLPLYEAKMLHHFDHRWATYEETTTRDITLLEKNNSSFTVSPRYWVARDEVTNQTEGWAGGWFIGLRAICRTTDERSCISSIFPYGGVGNSILLSIFRADDGAVVSSLAANLSAFVFDYAVRQKVGGINFNLFIINQLPVLSPNAYNQRCWWSREVLVGHWLAARVLELTYTAWDLAPTKEYGYGGPPFRWDENRRHYIRCEQDAAYFHLYGIGREDVDYIMESFPIVKRKDFAEYGTFRTKDLILDLYDQMARAIETGEPYRTRLDPPPGPPAQWPPEPGEPWPTHIHPLREDDPYEQ